MRRREGTVKSGLMFSSIYGARSGVAAERLILAERTLHGALAQIME
ncbi:MAG TPA: hypothetical protein VNV88_08600 [Candidatus Solibacter sp.]|nr:hypothetical protein [Candidatus Solibacter sp.]